MQRIIDRILYGTDLAEQIAEYAPSTDGGSIYHLVETLFKRADGEYFLRCRGGAMTMHGRFRGGSPTVGVTITPLSEDAALEWCEAREIDGAVVMAAFAHLIDAGEETP